MGQLTEALKANKELRKQFTEEPENNKVSKRDQEIINAIEKSDFGCQKENTYVFAEAITGRKIPRLITKNNLDCFSQVRGSVLIYRHPEHNPENKDDTAADLGSPHSDIVWGADREFSMSRYKSHWRPATDKEIKEYFS